MDKEITLNDVKYILKEEFDRIVKQKLFIEGKEKEAEITQKYLILDKCNVLAIVPTKDRDILEEEFELNINGIGKNWKMVSNDLIIPDIRGFGEKFDRYLVSKSKYSKEFIDMTKKTSKAFGYGSIPEVFLLWDKEMKEYIEDKPCLIVFERRMVFLLAPRIEDGGKD